MLKGHVALFLYCGSSHFRTLFQSRCRFEYIFLAGISSSLLILPSPFYFFLEYFLPSLPISLFFLAFSWACIFFLRPKKWTKASDTTMATRPATYPCYVAPATYPCYVIIEYIIERRRWFFITVCVILC